MRLPLIALAATVHRSPPTSIRSCGRLLPTLLASQRIPHRSRPPQLNVLSVNRALDFSLPYRVLAFYALAPIPEPIDEAVERHRAFLTKRDMVGRVYLCADGLNAQVSGTAQACVDYREWVASEFPSEQLVFKEDPLEEPAFPRLRVKHKGLVPKPKSGEEVDLSNRGEDLTPEAWAAMLEEGGSSLRNTTGATTITSPVVLDVRNNYEWDVGRFDKAERPALDHFTDFDAETFGLDPLDEKARKETPVMMYCTGGIRCEYFSARLKAQGFEKVYKLLGGVQHYGNEMGNKKEDEEEKEDDEEEEAAVQEAHVTPKPQRRTAKKKATPHWRGSLFVFDRRNTLRFGDEATGASPPDKDDVVGACMRCNTPTEAFVNCANIDCNHLHLICPKCLTMHKGFCSETCKTAPRRRPLDILAGTADGDEIDLKAVMAATQGAAPGKVDPNRLASFKPDNLPRREYDADKHLVESEN